MLPQDSGVFVGVMKRVPNTGKVLLTNKEYHFLDGKNIHITKASMTISGKKNMDAGKPVQCVWSEEKGKYSLSAATDEQCREYDRCGGLYENIQIQPLEENAMVVDSENDTQR